MVKKHGQMSAKKNWFSTDSKLHSYEKIEFFRYIVNGRWQDIAKNVAPNYIMGKKAFDISIRPI